MAACRNCKLLCDVNRTVAPDRGWCPVWEYWQKAGAPSCRHFEPREYYSRPERRPRDYPRTERERWKE